MTDKFQNRYRIPSTRLQNWDYRWSGSYFITICTHSHENYFGEINNGIMQLSPIGIIANDMWYEIKNHFQKIELSAFVVMPNHIHGILILKRMDWINEKNVGQQRFQNIGKNSVSSIIGSYKSAVTKHVNRLGVEFAWQRLFYDILIRDKNTFIKVEKYIKNNPQKWVEDRFYNF